MIMLCTNIIIVYNNYVIFRNIDILNKHFKQVIKVGRLRTKNMSHEKLTLLLEIKSVIRLKKK